MKIGDYVFTNKFCVGYIVNINPTRFKFRYRLKFLTKNLEDNCYFSADEFIVISLEEAMLRKLES